MNHAPRLDPLLQLLLARIREFVRTPEAVFWVYIFPIVMVVALGLAFRSKPVEAILVAIPDGPRAAALRDTLQADRRFQVTIDSADACRDRLRVGSSELVVIPKGRSDRGSLEYLYDPTRPGSVLARNAADAVLQRAAGRRDVLETSDAELSEPGSRYIDFLVPGLIGMGLMGGGMWGVGFAVVDLRIRHLLKRFLATPMRREDFLAAMMLSRLVFMLPEITVLLVFSWFAFDVVNHGSYLALGVIVLLGAFEFAGIGLLVASRAQTLEAVSGLMNLVMIPLWIGSGIFFSPDRFPEFVQPLIHALPLTPLISALRHVMLEGVGLHELTRELLMVTGWGVLTFAVALRIFRWE